MADPWARLFALLSLAFVSQQCRPLLVAVAAARRLGRWPLPRALRSLRAKQSPVAKGPWVLALQGSRKENPPKGDRSEGCVCVAPGPKPEIRTRTRTRSRTRRRSRKRTRESNPNQKQTKPKQREKKKPPPTPRLLSTRAYQSQIPARTKLIVSYKHDSEKRVVGPTARPPPAAPKACRWF